MTVLKKKRNNDGMVHITPLEISNTLEDSNVSILFEDALVLRKASVGDTFQLSDGRTYVVVKSCRRVKYRRESMHIKSKVNEMIELTYDKQLRENVDDDPYLMYTK